MTKAMRRTYLLTVLLAIFALSCSTDDDGAGDTNVRRTAKAVAFDSIVHELPGMDSVTVLEALQGLHEVEFSKSAMGVFVRQIDSVANSQRFFWVYSVNGKMASEACDRRLTKTGDLIRWHYRRFGGK